MLVSHEELAQKVLALERRYDGQFLDDPDWLTLDDLLPPSPQRGEGRVRGEAGSVPTGMRYAPYEAAMALRLPRSLTRGGQCQ